MDNLDLNVEVACCRELVEAYIESYKELRGKAQNDLARIDFAIKQFEKLLEKLDLWDIEGARLCFKAIRNSKDAN